ncbi:MAG: helix-turn-helix transcriptional regulator [Sporichthyaceae bacterium]
MTFLLTDIESSTAGWEADRAAMASAVARHYEILDEVIAAAGGVRPVEQGEGDSVVAAFARATDALRAAVEIQRTFAADGLPVAVRIALHTGEVALRDEGNYFGPAVIRCARLRAVAHGGQIVCSRSTADVAADMLPPGIALTDLGAHRLKDLSRPEQVFQVCHPDLRSQFPPLRSLEAIPNNLPVHLTSFVGREAELAELARLAAGNRLLTLAGPGGVGKTRLAARLAAEVAADRPDGVWWVELSALTDPDLVVEAVLTVLGVGDAGGTSALQRLLVHLANRDLLLVLDNCEHLVEECALLADSLLRGCPGVRLIGTSREALGVAGEVTWRVPPMGLPASAAPHAPDSLRTFDAVTLFVDRSVAARPNFVVDNATAPVIAEICARLDGIPLAIELAAARSRTLTPNQILAELEDRFRLLTGRTRGALARQQTLEASVAWSHDLLSEAERTAFRRLAVFAGGFGLDAAEAVVPTVGPGPDRGAVLDLLDSLVAKSMVATLDGPDGRYRLLETMRAFGARELAGAGETAAAREAHLAYFVGYMVDAEPDVLGINPLRLRRFRLDQDNVRSALDWALAAEDPSQAPDLAWRWGIVCLLGGRPREAGEWAARAAARTGASPGELANCVWILGLSACAMADVPGMIEANAALQRLAAEDGGHEALGRAAHLKASLTLMVDPEAALVAVAEAEAHAQAAGDLLTPLDLAADRTWIAGRADDLANGRKIAMDAVAHIDAVGNDWFGSWNYAWAALLARRAGDLGTGRALAGTGLRLAHGLGEAMIGALNTAVLAEIDILAGNPEQALRLVEPAVAACAEASGYVAFGYLTVVHGLALAGVGRPADAIETLRTAVGTGADLQDAWQHAQAALALARLLAGRGEDIAELLTAARACADNVRSPWVAAVADHLEGLAGRDLGRAEDLQHAALAVHVAQGYALDVVDTLEALAALAAAQESRAEAARLYGACAARREELGYRHGSPNLDALHEALGEEAFATALKEGEALSIDAAVAYASRARGERGRPSFGWASLTPTEMEVARLTADGSTNAAIGAALFISPNTVKTHLKNVYAKLGLATRAELVAEATRRQERRA